MEKFGIACLLWTFSPINYFVNNMSSIPNRFGRGKYHESRPLSTSSGLPNWAGFRFMVFDCPLPLIQTLPYEERYELVLESLPCEHPFLISEQPKPQTTNIESHVTLDYFFYWLQHVRIPLLCAEQRAYCVIDEIDAAPRRRRSHLTQVTLALWTREISIFA